MASTLDGWTWGSTINSPGDWNQSPQIMELMGLQGTDFGEWSAPDANGLRYIDTPYGRVDNSGQLAYLNQVHSGDDGGYQGPNAYGPWTGANTGGRHANEHGSDGIVAHIDQNGVLNSVKMNRESDADRNWALAAMATMGIGAALGAGGAAAGAGAGGSGGAAAGAGAAGAVESSVVPLTASEYAAMGAGGAGAGAGGAGGGGLLSALGGGTGGWGGLAGQAIGALGQNYTANKYQNALTDSVNRANQQSIDAAMRGGQIGRDEAALNGQHIQNVAAAAGSQLMNGAAAYGNDIKGAASVAGNNLMGGASMYGDHLQNVSGLARDRILQAAQQASQMSQFTPYNISGGLQGVNFNGTTAQKTMDPRLQAIQNQDLALSQGFLGGISTGTPQQLAEEAMARREQILAPQRMTQVSALQDRLAGQGMTGFKTNTTGVNGNNISINPQMTELYEAQERARLRNYNEDMLFGQQITQNQLGMGNQQLGQAMQIDAAGNQMIQLGQSLGDSKARAGATAGGMLLQGANSAGQLDYNSAAQAGNWGMQGLTNAGNWNTAAANQAAQMGMTGLVQTGNWATGAANQAGQWNTNAANNQGLWYSNAAQQAAANSAKVAQSNAQGDAARDSSLWGAAGGIFGGLLNNYLGGA